MMVKMNKSSAIQAIHKAGILLVFPNNNKKEPASLWCHFFPRKKMRWEWDSSGDSGVSDLWFLKTELSTTRKVIYTKWYQNKATYFSRKLFTAMLRALNPELSKKPKLSRTASFLLEILESDSPISAKKLRKLVLLEEGNHDISFDAALRELWAKLLIVAFGEVDDGSFPSLAIGATKTMFEDIWTEAEEMTETEALQSIAKSLAEENLFRRYFEKLQKRMPGAIIGNK